MSNGYKPGTRVRIIKSTRIPHAIGHEFVITDEAFIAYNGKWSHTSDIPFPGGEGRSGSGLWWVLSVELLEPIDEEGDRERLESEAALDKTTVSPVHLKPHTESA